MKTIFVSIASYRDNQCPITVKSIYENAKNPERVFVGICQQNKKEDVECIDNQDPLIQKWLSNIRIIKLPHYEAKGPTWARYLCSKLWNNEDYYFQIDSHTKLVKNWDEKIINMVENIPNEKSVISHYPPSIEEYEKKKEMETNQKVPRICKSFFNDREMISFEGAEIHNTDGNCYEVPYIAAGMFFCNSKFLDEVTFDPTLDYLFVGEEILLSARFWTNGWNIYTPSENIAYHFYTRKDEPKIWTDMVYKDDLAFEKVQGILKLKELKEREINDNYKLGNTRTLDEYYNFAGIDIANRKIVKNFCRPNNIADADNDDKIKSVSYKKIKIFLIVLLILVLLSFIGGYYFLKNNLHLKIIELIDNKLNIKSKK